MEKKKYYFSFGIDCAPLTPRPNVYAEVVFKHIGVEPFEAGSKLFGAWEWKYIELDLTEQEKSDLGAWMKSTTHKWYVNNLIRGAEWEFSDEPEEEIHTFEDMKMALTKNGVEFVENSDGSITTEVNNEMTGGRTFTVTIGGNDGK